MLYLKTIVHFTVVCLAAKPLNSSEAKGDLVMIQTLLCLLDTGLYDNKVNFSLTASKMLGN